jgi:hypothetical protein
MWFSLLGKPYSGGGGGIGGLRSVDIRNIEIYHQAYDGANNYHKIEDELKIKLETVIKKNFRMLIEQAMELMENEKKELAQKALDETNMLMEEAGLIPTDEKDNN